MLKDGQLVHYVSSEEIEVKHEKNKYKKNISAEISGWRTNRAYFNNSILYKEIACTHTHIHTQLL